MDDFFQLMVAQLANQDMYNTVDDTQFIAQMAQFSMVQALDDLSQLSITSYSVGLIGKEVTLAQRGSGDTLDVKKGIVEGVNLYNGSAQIVVDGTAYPLSSVMSVQEANIIVPDTSSLSQTNLINKISELVDEISELNDNYAKAAETSGTDETDDSAGTGGTDGTGESGGTEDTGDSGGTEGEGDV
jgi:flagellar basal-body rod modification protein FlgD